MGAEQTKLTSEQKKEYLETFRRLCLRALPSVLCFSDTTAAAHLVTQ